MQGAAERLGERLVGDGLGRARVDRAHPRRRRRAPRGRARPRHRRGSTGMYWAPPATGPPTPSLKNGSIFASAPPPWSSSTPVRTVDDAQAEVGRPLRLALPDHADFGEEVVAGRGLLVEPLVAVRAVVADRGGGDEHARARLGRLDPGHEVAGAELARAADAALGVVGPALGDVLAREVDDRVAAGERRGRRGLLLRLPRDGARGGRVARQRGDLVAAGAQALDELRAEQSAGSGDGDLHRGSTTRGGSCLTPRSRTCPPCGRSKRTSRSARTCPSSPFRTSRRTSGPSVPSTT